MKNISINISDKIDKDNLECLLTANTAAVEMGIEIMLVGAFVRDILFEYDQGIHSPRTTNDIDIVIAVKTTEDYKRYISVLQSKHEFKPTDLAQRFERQGVLIDIVPFGSNAFPTNKVSLDDGKHVMSLIGIEDVYKTSSSVIISEHPTVEIKIPTPAGLFILKLLSFNDDPSRAKDADDIKFIIGNFVHILDVNEIFDDYMNILEENEFDHDKESMPILAEQIKEILNESNLQIVEDILHQELAEENNYHLIGSMRIRDDSADDMINKLNTIYLQLIISD